MEYNRIISVTGLGGLFELVGSKADGAIVRSLEDKTTKFVSSRSHHFSHLESIEVYTIRENINLIDLFKAMKASTQAIPDYKSIEAVKNYFSAVYPDMDLERVYTSDMKKMVRWYNILIANDISFEVAPEEAANAAETATVADEAQTPQTDKEKAAPAKDKATKDTKETKDTAAEEKPKKKAAPKKKKNAEE